MAISVIRVLIINKHLPTALGMKQALERTGEFEVSSFTTPDAGLELLRIRPHDIAIIEFGLPSMNGQELVSRIRAIAPTIRILASPHMPNIVAIARQLGLDGVVDMPMPLRDLLPILKKLVNADGLPDTAEAPRLDESDTLEMALPPNPANEVLIKMGNSTLLMNISDQPQSLEVVLKGDVAELRENPHDDLLFKQLAAEEPPMPTLEEIGTVADLRDVVGQVDLARVSAVMQEAMTPHMPLLSSGEIANQVTEHIPAQFILRETADDSQSLQQVIHKLINNLSSHEDRQKLPLGWEENLEKYIREPDFLSIVFEQSADISYQTTHVHDQADVIGNPHDLQTEVYPKGYTPPQPTTLPSRKKKSDEVLSSLPAVESASESTDGDTLVSASPWAQLALILTQASLELSADATLLMQGADVVAQAGHLPKLEIAQICAFLAQEEPISPDEARIKFLSLPVTGQEYMIYSRQTTNGYTLSLVFSGSIPLRAVRKQGERLLNALQSVPELPQNASSVLDDLQERELEHLEESAQRWESSLSELSDMPWDGSDTFTPIPANLEPLTLPHAVASPDHPIIPELPYPIYKGTPAPFTYVWRLAQPDSMLSPRLRDLLGRELERQLTEMGIHITTLIVQETYVYLLADVPNEAAPHVVVQDLKKRSAWILHHIDPHIPLDGVWAESYCVLAPGREMQRAEIDRFIAFSVA